MTFDAQRGRIEPPDLDDRTWQDLVDQMRALIPKYAPTWTDHNPSDLGITLIELFAWLTESVLYRLNQVPEKNYVAFLNLLGITRDPPTPAHTYLTFTSDAVPVDIAAGAQAETAATEGRPGIVFETDEPVRVVPVQLDTALQVGPFDNGAATATYGDVTTALIGSPAAKTLVTLPAGKTVQLCFGLDAKPAEAARLGIRLYRPLPPGVAVTWVYSTAAVEPIAWTQTTAAELTDGTLFLPPGGGPAQALGQDGTVVLTPPSSWSAQRAAPASDGTPTPSWSAVSAATPADANTGPRFWLGLRLVNSGTAQSAVGIDRVLFNAAHASTALTLRVPEDLGVSAGTPFQTFPLRYRPLYRAPDPRAPYGHLVVEVGAGTPPVWQAWNAVEDLAAGPGEAYRVDPVVGEVSFGNYDPQTRQGSGSIPAAGNRIRATYRYVASGGAGNVAAGQVVQPGTTLAGEKLSAVRSVTNLAPAADGSDEEAVADTLRRAPRELKTRDRAVTAEDYAILAGEPNKSVSIAACLLPRMQLLDQLPAWKAGDPWTFAGVVRAPGNVTVVIVPDQGESVPRPTPTPELVDQVRDYLDQRRDIGVQLQVTGPRYLPIIVQAQVVIWKEAAAAGAKTDDVRADTLDRIAAFLHPTRGGPDGTGWRVGQNVYTSDLFQAIMPARDLGYISALQVKPDTPAYHYPPLNPTGTDGNYNPTLERPFALSGFGASVRLADYELVCAATGKHDVQPQISDS
ncbi:putative baseplate assembly protein [Kribbella sp. NPDC058693]|uniref:putative baseplate assembly protein n=1 Tax=Kribbella sp. NPDC058693 TaxID=3346602 RepID=UPI00366743E9